VFVLLDDHLQKLDLLSVLLDLLVHLLDLSILLFVHQLDGLLGSDGFGVAVELQVIESP
jgi:hypothetical protein